MSRLNVFFEFNAGILLTACVPYLAQTALSALSFLTSLKSPRVDEFRSACDAHFPLSTVFRSAEDQARLREEVKSSRKGEPLDSEKSEVIS